MAAKGTARIYQITIGLLHVYCTVFNTARHFKDRCIRSIIHHVLGAEPARVVLARPPFLGGLANQLLDPITSSVSSLSLCLSVFSLFTSESKLHFPFSSIHQFPQHLQYCTIFIFEYERYTREVKLSHNTENVRSYGEPSGAKGRKGERAKGKKKRKGAYVDRCLAVGACIAGVVRGAGNDRVVEG